MVIYNKENYPKFDENMKSMKILSYYGRHMNIKKKLLIVIINNIKFSF